MDKPGNSTDIPVQELESAFYLPNLDLSKHSIVVNNNFVLPFKLDEKKGKYRGFRSESNVGKCYVNQPQKKKNFYSINFLVIGE